VPTAFICAANLTVSRNARFTVEYQLLHCSQTGGGIQQIYAMQLICEHADSKQRFSGATIAPATDAGCSCPLVLEVLDLCGNPQIPVEWMYKMDNVPWAEP